MVNSEACGDLRQDINHVIFYCSIVSPKSAKLTYSFIDKTFPNTPTDIFFLLKNFLSKCAAFLQSHQLPHLNFSRQACISRALSEEGNKTVIPM